MRHYRILYLTAEQWPTFRSDIVTLFGKYLSILGLTTDLLTEQDPIQANQTWEGGVAYTCQVPSSRALQYIVKWLFQFKRLFFASVQHYDAIQVRDMVWGGVLALIAARLRNKPFFYWLSYPQSEGQIVRAQLRGWRSGLRYWFPLIQGMLGKWVLYHFLLPKADFIFVQSPTMLKHLVAYGVPADKQYAVPMGVDIERITYIEPAVINALDGRLPLIYLGTLDRTRQLDFLLDVMVHIKRHFPEALLIMAGDTEEQAYAEWLKSQAIARSLSEHVMWTGWLPMDKALSLVKAAKVGFSPFPRSEILDMASPTKAVEYLALGVPVVCNDNPDQATVVHESGAGFCIPYTADAFAKAAMTLLQDSQLCHEMATKGRQYVLQHRSYEAIAKHLFAQYERLIP